ncbi:hypothetical protein FB451DRAFT_1268978 [Mycena latifolia]|nr:hypothetical protein FB451DRAFT_1268978 [Mycena latifolia]
MLALALLICLSSAATVFGDLQPTIYRDLPCKFTLAAWNVTRPNANSTGVPLVLGQDTVNDGPNVEVTSTYASYPSNVYPTLSLSNGSLRAYRASGVWNTNATAVASGGLLSWFTSPLFNHEAARIYTAVQKDAGPHSLRVLAALGVHNRWSLCPSYGPLQQTSVVFNVSADVRAPADMGVSRLAFDPRLCWEVKIYLVPADSLC